MISSHLAESLVNQSYEKLEHIGNRQERQQHEPIQNVSLTRANSPCWYKAEARRTNVVVLFLFFCICKKNMTDIKYCKWANNRWQTKLMNPNDAQQSQIAEHQVRMKKGWSSCLALCRWYGPVTPPYRRFHITFVVGTMQKNLQRVLSHKIVPCKTVCSFKFASFVTVANSVLQKLMLDCVNVNVCNQLKCYRNYGFAVFQCRVSSKFWPQVFDMAWQEKRERN